MPRWVLPAVIFLLLFFLFANRYEVNSTTKEGYKYVFVRDKWSGCITEKIYKPVAGKSSYQELDLCGDEYVWWDLTWASALLITFIWLYLSVRRTLIEKSRKEGNLLSIPQKGEDK